MLYRRSVAEAHLHLILFDNLRVLSLFTLCDKLRCGVAIWERHVRERTIADGIAVAKPGHIPFELIAKHIDKVVTVTDDEIAKAIVVLLERAKQVVEPAGAAAVAALMSGAVKPKGKTVAVLSGGNIDPLLMQKIIGFGLTASERYTTISVMLPDRPGQLVKTAEAIAAAQGNVVEVLHTRHGEGLEIGEVELRVSVETMGHEHRERVLTALREAGLQPRISQA